MIPVTGKNKKKGRPLQSPEVRDNVLSLRLNSTELNALNIYCERYDTKASVVIRDALMVLSVIPSDLPFRNT